MTRTPLFIFALALFLTSFTTTHNAAAQSPGNPTQVSQQRIEMMQSRLDHSSVYWTEVWSLTRDTGLQFEVDGVALNPAIYAAVRAELLPIIVHYTSRPECEVRLIGTSDRHLNGGSNDSIDYKAFATNQGNEMGLEEARSHNVASTAADIAQREGYLLANGDSLDIRQVQLDPSPKERDRGVDLMVKCHLTEADIRRIVREENERTERSPDNVPDLARRIESSVTADFDIEQLNRNSFRFTSSARFTGCTDPQYLWEVNGFEREGQVINNVFDAPGRYAVTHRVTCSDQEDTETKYITVLPLDQTSSTRDYIGVGGGDDLSFLSVSILGGQAKNASVPRDASSPPPASCSLCGSGEVQAQDESGPSGPVTFYGAGLTVHQRFTDVIGGSLTVGGVGGQVETDEGNFSQLFGYVGGGLTAFLDPLVDLPVNLGVDGALLVNQEGVSPAVAGRIGIDL